MAQERKRSARKGGRGKIERPGVQALAKRMPAHVAWVVVSAVVLVLAAPGLFVAGFFTNELVSEEGGTAAVAQPSPSARTPTPQPTPSPTPVAVSVDDAPAWGPGDAKVTVVEFADYQ